MLRFNQEASIGVDPAANMSDEEQEAEEAHRRITQFQSIPEGQRFSTPPH